MMIRSLGIADRLLSEQDAAVTTAANFPSDPSYSDPSAFEAARAICQQHARSFYFASMFLPRPKRNAAYAVYAFCRLLDDATDEADNPAETSRRIDQFVGLLNHVYQSAKDPPSFTALVPGLSQFLKIGMDSKQLRSTETLAFQAFAITVHRYDIPKTCFIEIADGCRMDLTISRYQTWDDLRKYCYRVAGVVGIIMSRVFGLADPSAEAQAIMMGEAMQLTNILRDIKEDAERGRIYLPLEDLDRFGYTQRDLLSGVVNDAFRQLMRFEIERARGLYRAGAQGLVHLVDDGSRLTATAMGVIYAGILKAIERQDYDVFSKRARLTLVQKLLRLPQARRIARAKDPGGDFSNAF